MFPSDPERKERTEDPLLGWTMKEYMEDPDHNPEWLGLLPMVKSSYQAMKAAEDFVNNNLRVANISGWIVSGASKRGWATWTVGMARCESCVKVIGLLPIVPIVPSLYKDIHR